MNDPLATYLHDHLGAAETAVELLENWSDEKDDVALVNFAREILSEVEADRETLRTLISRVGASRSTMKEAAGWIGEKAARFKLRHEANGALGIFEGLELLAIGVLGKLALWDALAVAAVHDSRLREVDFTELAARAKEQHARIEGRRLNAAVEALARSS